MTYIYEKNILCLEHLNLKIDDNVILRDIHLQIKDGEMWGIAGESGAGKSMTMYCAAALLPVGSNINGKIYINTDKDHTFSFNSSPADELSYKKTLEKYKEHARKSIAIVLQDSINALNPHEKIYKQWSRIIGRYCPELTKPLIQNHIEEQLTHLGFSKELNIQNLYPHELSGGMRQRITIAMALKKKAKLLICDEPTTSLDTINQRKTIKLITDMVKERKLSLIYISHNLGIIQEICSHVAIMQNGEIVEKGPVSNVLSKPRHDYTKYLIRETYKLWESHKNDL